MGGFNSAIEQLRQDPSSGYAALEKIIIDQGKDVLLSTENYNRALEKNYDISAMLTMLNAALDDGDESKLDTRLIIKIINMAVKMLAEQQTYFD